MRKREKGMRRNGSEEGSVWKAREEGVARMLGMAGIVPGDCGQEERSSTPTCREAWRAAENDAAVTEKECSAVEKTQQRHRAPRMNAVAENNANVAARPRSMQQQSRREDASRPRTRSSESKIQRSRTVEAPDQERRSVWLWYSCTWQR